ncbi:MAG: glycosyltransferase [Paludibacter sp.]
MDRFILFISLFGDVNIDYNCRIGKVYNAFEGFDRLIVTADFNHSSKQYKSYHNSTFTKYIHVPSYQKNLSIKRVYSHIVFAIKLKKYLNRVEVLPKLIYCTMPSSLSAFYCGKFCKKKDVRFVIDVIDLWPDSLFPISFKFKLLKPFIYPWKFITNQAYSMADYISAESNMYAKIALSKGTTSSWSYTYLGVDVEEMNRLVLDSNLITLAKNDEIWICYGGSLGNSYDFDSILKAIKYIDDKAVKYRFFFVGGGEYQEYISKYIQLNNLNVEITGRIPYNDYLKYLSCCDIAINSFKKTTEVIYSYKFNDYVGLKLFVLNNLVGETADIVKDYQIGLNFNEFNLPEILFDVCDNWDHYKSWKNNSIKLIDDKLNTSKIYNQLSNHILSELKIDSN